MSELKVDYAALTSAATVWDEAADTLDGAWHRLANTDGSPVAYDVRAAFVEFRETWTDYVKEVARDAQEHSESLKDSARAYAFADDAAQELMRRLLPFSYRDSEFVRSPPYVEMAPPPALGEW